MWKTIYVWVSFYRYFTLALHVFMHIACSKFCDSVRLNGSIVMCLSVSLCFSVPFLSYTRERKTKTKKNKLFSESHIPHETKMCATHYVCIFSFIISSMLQGTRFIYSSCVVSPKTTTKIEAPAAATVVWLFCSFRLFSSYFRTLSFQS